MCLKTLVADAVRVEPVSTCFTCSSGKSWRAYADFGLLLQNSLAFSEVWRIPTLTK